nr:unnamed protein product [Spirometra erinaceieuropaei]
MDVCDVGVSDGHQGGRSWCSGAGGGAGAGERKEEEEEEEDRSGGSEELSDLFDGGEDEEARKSQQRLVRNADVQPLPAYPRCQRTFRTRIGPIGHLPTNCTSHTAPTAVPPSVSSSSPYLAMDKYRVDQKANKTDTVYIGRLHSRKHPAVRCVVEFFCIFLA